MNLINKLVKCNNIIDRLWHRTVMIMKTRYLVNAWKEFELGKKCAVYIFRTKGCAWRNCSMCSYYSVSDTRASRSIRAQIEEAKKYYQGEEIVKIYTSGSFLDTSEVSADLQIEILSSFEDAKKIVIESRPEFVIKNINNIIDFSDRVEVAIGLESSNEKIREISVNKGFTLSTFEEAIKKLKSSNFNIRTYILLKPPLLYEIEAINDSISSIAYANDFSTVISLNPLNVQKNTVTEKLFLNGEYDPPWFWSLVEILNSVYGTVISKPSGAGTLRGIHNCGKCDSKFIETLNIYNNTLEKSILNEIECECKELWQKYLKYEILVRSYGISPIRREKFLYKN